MPGQTRSPSLFGAIEGVSTQQNQHDPGLENKESQWLTGK
jgi:hypothetical protein